LRWFGHAERKGDDDWVKRCIIFLGEHVTGRRAGNKPPLRTMSQLRSAWRVGSAVGGGRQIPAEIGSVAAATTTYGGSCIEMLTVGNSVGGNTAPSGEHAGTRRVDVGSVSTEALKT
jgi:hypothetical protein